MAQKIRTSLKPIRLILKITGNGHIQCILSRRECVVSMNELFLGLLWLSLWTY